MLKKITIILLGITVGCANPTKKYLPAENGLDAGRQFIEASKNGDFNQAEFYLLKDAANSAILKVEENIYREKDKEGRQAMKLSSINIKSVQDVNDSTVKMEYYYSSDTVVHQLWILQKNKTWLVDLTKKN